MAERDRRNHFILLAIIGGFLFVGLALYVKNRQPGGPVDVNRASVSQLDRLPEVGPAMAREIVRGRPFKSYEDLLRVRGIGPKTLEKIRPFIENPAE